MLEHERKTSTPIDKAIHKHGIKNFEAEVVDQANDEKELDQKEMYWIHFFKSEAPNGYNYTKGSRRSIGYHHTEETKEKMRRAKEGRYIGADNPFFGKHHSKEQRERWSEQRKGLRHFSEKQIKNLRDSHFTKKVLCVETGVVYNAIEEAALAVSGKATHITRVCRGKRKTTCGYHWKYVD